MSQIRVELQLEDKSFVQGVWRAGQSLKEFKTELARTVPHFAQMQKAGQDQILSFRRQEEQTRSLGQRFRDVAIMAGGATIAFRALTGAGNGTVGSVIRINAEMERLRYQLAGMSHAADPMKEATDQLAYLQKLATETPFSAQELSKSFVKLKAAGLDPMNGSLRALTDGLAAFGGSDENLHRVTIALTQMQGKGVLSMEELRQQLGESMPNAMQLFARSMGVTVGELSKMVSTGMVESTSAIEKFMGELDRSYAGTGQFMMQTFSGLMSRINTEFTNLVTGGPRREGEMAKAFDMLKERMSDLADFLASQDAKKFFDSIGLGLQALMTGLQNLMPVLKDTRDFLVEWGSTIAMAFGGIAVVKLLSSFGAKILAVKVAYQEMATAARKAKAEIMLTNSVMAIGNSAQLAAINAQAAAALAARQATRMTPLSSASGVGSALVATAGATGGIASSLVKAGTALSRFLGMIGPVGLGLAVLGPIAWEIGKGIYSWATGAKETNEALKETIESQAEALRLQRAVDREALVKRRDGAADRYARDVETYGRDNPSKRGEIEVAQKALDEFDAETNRIVGDFLLSSTDAQVTEAKTRIAEGTREISRAYNQSMIDMDDEFREAMENAEKNGRSVRDVQEEFRNRRNDKRIERQKVLIKAYDAEIEKLTEIAKLNNVSPEAVAFLIEERERLRDEMNQWSPDDFKVELISGVESEEKKVERLTKTLEGSREKFKELQAEIGGASGELAKLIYRIERGDFGNFETGTEEMTRMRDILIETTIAVEALDEVMGGLNKTNSEAARGLENAREENLRLKAMIDGIDPTNEFDFYKWKRENGLLEGLGDPKEVVQEAIAAVTSGIDLSRVMFDAMGTTLKQQAFGEESVMRIDAVANALGRVHGLTSSINEQLLGINFGNMNAPGGTGAPLIRGNVDGGILDLIAGPESGGDYNATLDHGRWTNGPKSLTTMTLNEIRELQRYMLSHEENRNKYRLNGKPTGSSALGRYQIVGSTLEGLMRDLGLSGDELFDEAMQDRLASELVRQAGGPAGIRKTWEGLKGYSDATINDALGRSRPGPTVARAAALDSVITEETGQALLDAAIAGQKQEGKTFNEWSRVDEENEALTPKAALAERKRELQVIRDAQLAGTGDEKQGTNERRVREEMARGDYKGLPNDQVQELIDLAIAADKHLADLQERSKDQSRLDANSKKMEEDRREIEQRRLEALEKAKNPNYKGQSDELRKFLELEREQLALAEKLYGKDTEEYRNEAKRLAEQRSAIMGAEGAEAYRELSDAAREAEDAAITDERQKRQIEFERRVAELTALRDQAIANGMSVAEANMMFERAVAAERARLLEENKSALMANIEAQMNYAKSINDKMANLPQQLSSALYDSFSDKDAFKAFGNNLREQIARSLTDAAAAYFLKPFEKFLGGGEDGKGGIGGMIEGLIGKLTGDKGGKGVGGVVDETVKKLTGGVKTVMEAVTGGGGLGGLLGKGNRPGGKKSPIAAGAKGKGIPVGVKHTGGIVGRSGGWSSTSPIGNFIGAPRFHTGGIVGQSKFRSGLRPSEVPIIAQKNEGIFTPEQMKHLGGTVNNRSFAINAPITLNASGGTPEQNADLAARVSEQTEKMIRGIVHQEMLGQMRPGGMLKG